MSIMMRAAMAGSLLWNSGGITLSSAGSSRRGHFFLVRCVCSHRMKAMRSSSEAGSSWFVTGGLMAAPGAHRIDARASRVRGWFMRNMCLTLLPLTVMQRAGAFVARHADHAGCVSSPGTLPLFTMGDVPAGVGLKLVEIQSQVTLPAVLLMGVC